LPFEGCTGYYFHVPTYLKAYNQADYLLIAENDQGINNFIANGIPKNKIKRYNNFCDDEVWLPGLSRREKFTFVLWGSGLGIRKGLPALYEAWKGWFRGQEAEMHIFGIPTQTTDCMFKGLRHGSPTPGLFLHLDLYPAQDPRIIKFLGEAHVGVYPTLEDAQPSSLLEMASCALPIITTRESGVDFTEDFCRYVAADSVDDLQESMDYWFERREEIDTAGKRARMFIRNNHTKELLHKRFKQIIYEILSEHY
jgi:glycosyltransferase involved in cell wall biosynthesis